MGRSRKNVTYDSYGNIRSKTGIGTYSYSNARPNAVSAAGGVTYAYDDNGNNTSSSDGPVITYNSFDKVKSAAKSGHTTSFKYGPDRARYKRIDTKSGNTTTTLYIGNVEKITYPNNTRAIKRYIDGLVIKTLNYNSGRTLTSADTHYTLSDHPVSVDVITSGSGVITQQLSYDAWGLRRLAVSWQDLSASSITNFNTDLTRRGFTGHEHMDEVGIIHMNGRIYDPRLGRFLQADPFVDNAYNTQAFNRYSYLGNNPLNGTDPTGFFSFREALAIVVVIVVAYLTYGLASTWAAGTVWGGTAGAINITGGIVAGAIAGAAGGFVSGLIATGSIQGGLHGAAFGALSGAIFGGLAAGFGEGLSFGVGGGISNLLQGGKFGHGFVSAAISTLAGGASWLRNRGVAVRTAVNAAIGGTLSKVTGGKFANGAVTSAFATVVEGVAQAASRAIPSDSQLTPEQQADLAKRQGLAMDEVKVAYESGALGEGRQFSSIDEAAKEVLGVLDPISQTHQVELGGFILGSGDGFIYDAPIVGTQNSMSGMVNVPSGALAGFHTHPAGSRFFSFNDAKWVNGKGGAGIPLYVSGKGQVRACGVSSDQCNPIEAEAFPYDSNNPSLQGRVVP